MGPSLLDVDVLAALDRAGTVKADVVQRIEPAS